MKLVIAAFSLMVVFAVQAGIVVDAQSDVPQKTDGSSSSGDYSLCGDRLCLTLP